MKKILLGVLFLPTLSLAQVEVDKKVVCGPTDSVFESIAKDWKEFPIWGSKLQDSGLVLTINKNTKTWTIVQFNQTTACIIEAGNNYQFSFEES